MTLFKGIIQISSVEDKYELLTDDDKQVIEKMIDFLLERKS